VSFCKCLILGKVGGITVFGASKIWGMLVDEAVRQRKQIVMKAGVTHAATLAVSANVLPHLWDVSIATLASDI
jgi:prolyl-tRNA editing enzyme YbaK/EbsC (Cys-tRNA(Pro) deacylase)